MIYLCELAELSLTFQSKLGKSDLERKSKQVWRCFVLCKNRQNESPKPPKTKKNPTKNTPNQLKLQNIIKINTGFLLLN